MGAVERLKRARTGPSFFVHASPGRLSLISLALSAALAAPQVWGQSATVTWTIGNLTNASGQVIDGNLGTGVLGTSGPLGTLTNDGTISGSLAVSNEASVDAIVNGSTGKILASNVGIYNVGTISTLNNSGVLFGTTYAISNDTLSNNGTILASGTIGVLVNTGMITAETGIYNAATINAINNNGGTISGSGSVGDAIANNGSIGSLVNSGAILGHGYGAGVFNSSTIDALNNSSLIRGGINNVANYINGASVLATITTLTNSGTIVANGLGSGAIDNNGYIGTLNNSGLVSGALSNNRFTAAAVVMGTIANLTNSGTVSNQSGVAINNNGVIGTLTNSGSGLIAGGTTGIYNNGSISALSNSGVISGVTAYYQEATSTLGTLVNSGTISGKILNLAGTALNIGGGTGTVFGTLTGAAGSIGTLSSAGDVNFTSGNQLLNDHISVNAGIGTVTNAATLQINNPLTITGNYVQGSGANLIVGVVNPSFSGNLTDSGYGRLVVSGNATLDDSSITVKSAGHALAQGQRYVVLAAAGTISASGVSYAASGFNVIGTLQADSNNASYLDLVLTLGGTGPANSASGGNSGEALRGLFNYSGTDSSLLSVFNPAAALEDADSANKAGDQLSPAAITNAAISSSTAAFGAVQGAAGARMDSMRTAQAGGSGVATGEGSLAPAGWGRMFGGLANQAQRDGVAGYHAHYGGFMLGGDVQPQDNWRVGGLFSYARTNVGNEGNNTGSSASVNSYGLTAYAGYDGRPWYLNLTAGVARQHYSTSRTVGFTGFSGNASGSFRGMLYATSAEAGYPLAIGDVTLTPLAGVRYSTLRQDGYTESGGGGAALVVSGSTNSSLKSQLGAKLERSVASSYGELKPFAQLGWNHEFHATRLVTNASFAADNTGTTSFTAQGASPLRNTAVLSLGAGLLRGKNLSLQARYTLEAARGYTAQTGDLSLRWQY